MVLDSVSRALAMEQLPCADGITLYLLTNGGDEIMNIISIGRRQCICPKKTGQSGEQSNW